MTLLKENSVQAINTSLLSLKKEFSNICSCIDRVCKSTQIYDDTQLRDCYSSLNVRLTSVTNTSSCAYNVANDAMSCVSCLQTQVAANTTEITDLKSCLSCSYCDASYSNSKLTLTRSNGQCTELTIQAGTSIDKDCFVHTGQLGEFADFNCFKACLTTSPGVGHWQGSFIAASTWYGFTWVPHRTGVGGDNYRYGMLTYWLLTGSCTTIYHCKYSSGVWYQGVSFTVV